MSFGLVVVPVRMFRAVSPKDLHFHLIHEKDGGRIRQKRVCSVDGAEVPAQEIVKGFEVAKNQHVLFTKDELDALAARASKSIEIEDFVRLSEIDPVFFSSTDYLVPEPGAEKAYALLTRAMREAEKVGIARVVIRSRQNLCAVRPLGEGLVLSTMYSADEIVPREQVEEARDAPFEPNPRELAMAGQLIESLSARFEPEKYRDEYRERMREAIQEKAEGKKIVAPPEDHAPAKVVSLMDALKKSLAASEKRAPATQGARRTKTKAARVGTRRKA